MKREVKLFLPIFFVVIFLTTFVFAEITGEVITGDSITGQATTNTLIFNVSVIVLGPPSLSLHSPKNLTYTTNNSLLINYSISGAQGAWYNLDNGINTTLSNSSSIFHFNTSKGQHNFTLYANNSQGLTVSKNVTFFINLTQFTIIYSNFSSFSNTTRFEDFSFEEYQNITNLALENQGKGRILFPGAINLTNITGTTLDLDSYVNISSNKIEINSSGLPIFNTSAKLVLYGLSFSNPRVLIDGSVCSATDCIEESYSSGVLVFNVTHFTTYSAEETPSSSSSPSSGSSGGGGGGSSETTSTALNIKVSPEKLIIKLKQGENKREEVEISNLDVGLKTLTLSLLNLEGIAELRNTTLVLSPGETKKIVLDFTAKEDQKPDTYVGKLLIKSGKEEKEIIIAVDISSKKSLFDIKLEIPEDFSNIYPGREVLGIVTLYNLGEKKRVDVNLEYSIKDSQGNTIKSEKQTLAVETQLTTTIKLRTPYDIEPGEYLFSIKVTYEEDTAAVASASFTVKESIIQAASSKLIEGIIIISIVIIIIAIVIIIIAIIALLIERPSKKRDISLKGLFKGNKEFYQSSYQKTTKY